MTSPSARKTHRTLALIFVAWASSAGLYAAHPDWSPWPWVAIIIGALAMWVGGKAAATALTKKFPTGG